MNANTKEKKMTRGYSATDRQIVFLRRLLNQSFSKLFDHRTGLDANHLEGETKKGASAAIAYLIEAKNSDWKHTERTESLRKKYLETAY